MLHMKRVGDSHSLFLDTKTDKSHLISMWDDKPILTFTSDCHCYDSEGKLVCRLKSDKNGNWITVNDLGIETKPVSTNKSESIFDVEKEFCEKWLELNLDLIEKLKSNSDEKKPSKLKK